MPDTKRPKCPECGAQSSHYAYCSQAPAYPTPKGPYKKDPKKQHPLKRDDDGRRNR